MKQSATLLLASGALFSLHATAKNEAKKPMNIIYIMTDDHTRQAISCYGSRYGYTPNIDRLAQEGVRFDNSFVANSISGPSRACLLTGKHSHANGFLDNASRFDGNQQTVQKLMSKAGYETAIIGKWHLGSNPIGFDHWEILPGQGDYYNPWFINSNGRHQEPGYVTEIITNKCIEWIEKERDPNKPFLLFMHHKAPHRNWLPDEKNLFLYEDMPIDLPDNFWDSYEGRLAAKEQDMSIEKTMLLWNDLKVFHPSVTKYTDSTYLRTMNPTQLAAWRKFYNPMIEEFVRLNPKGKALTEWKYRRYVRDYLKTAQSVDQSIGHLLEYLTLNGMLENTLIVYTSDQGFYMGEHGWFDKRFMYEESFSTPMVARLPKNYFDKRGFVDKHMVQNIDHAATFLNIAGASIPEDIQGESYLPLLEKKAPGNWRKSLYYHYYEYPAEHSVKRHYGVRTDRYKLIHFYNDIDTWELYDLKTDPTEMHNLINDPKYKKTIDQLKVELKKLQTKYNVKEGRN